MRRALSFLLLFALLCGGATAQTLYAQAITLPLAVNQGGTSCIAASGTCLDSITGFASDGFVERTGAGAYSLIADPLPVAHGGTGLAILTAGNLMVGNGTGTPTFLPPTNGDCPVGNGTTWTVSACSGGTNSFPTIVTAFTTSCTGASPCTWTRNANTVTVEVIACAGGGSGAQPTNALHGGGAGGSGYCDDVFLTAAEAGSETISLGAAGVWTSGAGVAGGPTCFGGGATATCGATIGTSNVLYFGGGCGGGADVTAGIGGNAFATCPTNGANGTLAGSAGVSGGAGGNGAPGSQSIGGGRQAGGGGGGGGTTSSGGNGGYGRACNVIATGGTSGAPGNPGTTPTNLSWGTYLPGCGGGGGGDGTTSFSGGLGGSGTNGGGGGGGGGSATGTEGGGGNGGGPFMLVVEHP